MNIKALSSKYSLQELSNNAQLRFHKANMMEKMGDVPILNATFIN